MTDGRPDAGERNEGDFDQGSYRLRGDQVRPTFVYSADSGWRTDSTDAPAGCVIDGQDSELALFMLGRRPAGSSTLTASDSALLAEFKRYLPGP